MWRQAPITAAIVIAAGIASASSKVGTTEATVLGVGMARGLHRVAEVFFGSIVGVLVSLLMSRVWLDSWVFNSFGANGRHLGFQTIPKSSS